MISAKIIADSLCPKGNRLTTFEIYLPRIVLAEFNTHRMFTRNSASSRAIPSAKMRRTVKENPFIPTAFQKAHKGMQGKEYFIGIEEGAIENQWISSSKVFADEAEKLDKLGVTKQLSNRMLETFMMHKVIMTSGEDGLNNFFKLRAPQYEDSNGVCYNSVDDYLKVNDDKDDQIRDLIGWLLKNQSGAEIHIQSAAEKMWNEYNSSKPKQLKAGEWHIPYGDDMDGLSDFLILESTDKESIFKNLSFEEAALMVAVARCARLSYQTLGDNPKVDYMADLNLYNRLANMEHWSPFEHIAQAMSNFENNHYTKTYISKTLPEKILTNSKPETVKWNFHPREGVYIITEYGWCRNFRGFIQKRAMVDETR